MMTTAAMAEIYSWCW